MLSFYAIIVFQVTAIGRNPKIRFVHFVLGGFCRTLCEGSNIAL